MSGICECHGESVVPWSPISVPMVPSMGTPRACAAVAAADCQKWLLPRLSGVSIPLTVAGVYAAVNPGAAGIISGCNSPELDDGD